MQHGPASQSVLTRDAASATGHALFVRRAGSAASRLHCDNTVFYDSLDELHSEELDIIDYEPICFHLFEEFYGWMTVFLMFDVNCWSVRRKVLLEPPGLSPVRGAETKSLTATCPQIEEAT